MRMKRGGLHTNLCNQWDAARESDFELSDLAPPGGEDELDSVDSRILLNSFFACCLRDFKAKHHFFSFRSHRLASCTKSTRVFILA